MNSLHLTDGLRKFILVDKHAEVLTVVKPTRANWLLDIGDSGPGAQWETPALCEKSQKARHVLVSFDGARRRICLDATAWVLWVRDETGSFKKVGHGGRVLMDISAMVAEREALRMGTERLTALFSNEN